MRHSAIRPRYIRSRINTEVSRASHTQYAPHIGRPHSMPVTRQISVKAAPIGIAALAATSASGWRHHQRAERGDAHRPISMASQAAGTSNNMIFTTGPCS